MITDQRDAAAAVGLQRREGKARGADCRVAVVAGPEAGERGEAEGADPCAPLGRCRVDVGPQYGAAKRARQRFQLQLPAEDILEWGGDTSIEELLNVCQAAAFRMRETGEEEPVFTGVSAVDRN